MSTEDDVTKHARAQADAIEGLAVPANGVLVGCAGGHVLVGHRRHAQPRALLELGQAQDVLAVGVVQHVFSRGPPRTPARSLAGAPSPRAASSRRLSMAQVRGTKQPSGQESGCRLDRMPTYSLRINGRTRQVEGEPDDNLLAALRYELDLTGSKFGCGEGLLRRLHGARRQPGHARLRHAPRARSAARPSRRSRGSRRATACTPCSRRFSRPRHFSAATARRGW